MKHAKEANDEAHKLQREHCNLIERIEHNLNSHLAPTAVDRTIRRIPCSTWHAWLRRRLQPTSTGLAPMARLSSHQCNAVGSNLHHNQKRQIYAMSSIATEQSQPEPRSSLTTSFEPLASVNCCHVFSQPSPTSIAGNNFAILALFATVASQCGFSIPPMWS
jgi:hypothetical protein